MKITKEYLHKIGEQYKYSRSDETITLIKIHEKTKLEFKWNTNKPNFKISSEQFEILIRNQSFIKI
jgi:hypothetical protein